MYKIHLRRLSILLDTCIFKSVFFFHLTANNYNTSDTDTISANRYTYKFFDGQRLSKLTTSDYLVRIVQQK